VWGFVVVNASATGRVVWGVIDADGTGWTSVPPALAGLIVCDAAILYAARRMHRQASDQTRRSAKEARK
jgi:hypothetical protein